MKVVLQVELELEPENDLAPREQQDVLGMMKRRVKHRLTAFLGQRLGGERAPVGWEVHVRKIDVTPVSKVR